MILFCSLSTELWLGGRGIRRRHVSCQQLQGLEERGLGPGELQGELHQGVGFAAAKQPFFEGVSRGFVAELAA